MTDSTSILTAADEREVVTSIARRVLEVAAPDELVLFDDTTADYFRNPHAALDGRGRDESVGFGRLGMNGVRIRRVVQCRTRGGVSGRVGPTPRLYTVQRRVSATRSAEKSPTAFCSTSADAGLGEDRDRAAEVPAVLAEVGL